MSDRSVAGKKTENVLFATMIRLLLLMLIRRRVVVMIDIITIQVCISSDFNISWCFSGLRSTPCIVVGNILTYNAAIAACHGGGQWRRALWLLTEAQSYQLEGNSKLAHFLKGGFRDALTMKKVDQWWI